MKNLIISILLLFSASAFAETSTQAFTKPELLQLLKDRATAQTGYKMFLADLQILRDSGYENVGEKPNYVFRQEDNGDLDEIISDLNPTVLGVSGVLVYQRRGEIKKLQSVKDTSSEWLFTWVEITSIQLRVEYKWNTQTNKYELEVKNVQVETKKGKLTPQGVSSTGG